MATSIPAACRRALIEGRQTDVGIHACGDVDALRTFIGGRASALVADHAMPGTGEWGTLDALMSSAS